MLTYYKTNKKKKKKKWTQCKNNFLFQLHQPTLKYNELRQSHDFGEK